MAAMGSQGGSSTWRSYHVFLSFRAEDNQTTFFDHLYTALLNAGLRTFKNDGLERADEISSELIKVIEESRISVIVFSKDYAFSRWCLDDLLMILERKKSVGHMILPVFYYVDPSDLRWQKGSFAEAFAKHEERFKSTSNERKEEGMEKIRRWKEALREVADLAGLVLKDGHELHFVQKIVEEACNKLNRGTLSVCPYSVGLDSRINDITLWLQDGSNEVGILTICGMRGIGKTTIAKAVYNQNFYRFEGSSFLANVRETSQYPDGLVRLQKKILSDILKGKEVKISNVAEGIMMIREAIRCKRILLVIDDVDEQDQLDAVLITRDWFQQGSKIIITSTNEQLLMANELNKMYKVKELTDDESFQLFCWHAFRQDHPIESYMMVTKRVVKYCGGLPLALLVLGSSLYQRSIDVWESAIQKLEVIPSHHITEKLRITFDSLDEHDKKLFLDIACFFVGMDQDFVITVLDGCKYFTKVGIDNLIKRGLLVVNIDNKKLIMHQLLRDMGREIIRQESPECPGKRSRLWHYQDALDVLRERTGTQTIEGLILNIPMANKESFGFKSNLPMSNELYLQTDAFSRMHSLRLLQLNNARLTGNYEQFPRKLRWLCWRGFPLESIPNEFPLESVVALDMRNSSLKRVWKGNKFLRSLKILNFSHCHRLTSTPDFSNLPNLERLIFKNYVNLIVVHDSIGGLGRLVLLNLKGCKNLRKLSTKFGQLKSLEKLILSGCSKLIELPRELGEMKSLKVLHADGTAINQSLSTVTEVRSRLSRFSYWLLGPRKNPESISFSLSSLPPSLSSLSLVNCNLSDDAIPRDIGSLFLLKELNLSENPISSLPESIKGLNMLKSLGLRRCRKLRSLPELPISLNNLDLCHCRSLEMVPNLPNMLGSLLFVLYGCGKLVQVQEVFKLEPIRSVDAEIINILGLSNLELLGNVKVNLYNNMTFTERKVRLQGLYEFGIFSTFLPGNEIPGWFSNKSTGSSICFNVSSIPNLEIRGLNICVIYAHADRHSSYMREMYWNMLYISMSNETKNLEWTYSPTFVGIPDDNKYMKWLCHWKLGNTLEVGDAVKVSVDSWAYFNIKEFGIHVVYKQKSPRCQEEVNDGALSACQLRGNLLCNFIHQMRLTGSPIVPHSRSSSSLLTTKSPKETETKRRRLVLDNRPTTTTTRNPFMSVEEEASKDYVGTTSGGTMEDID